MGDDGGAIRMSITVPRSLKARMDAVRESVNWSKTAADAFSAKLLELESRKETKNMDEVVARLRAAAELEANEEYQAGMEAGRAWALQQATPKQLRRASEYINSVEEWWDTDSPMWNAPFGATDYFVFDIWPSRKDDRHAPGEFWERALGDDARRVEDADYFRGFGEGAAEVWDQVADKL